MFLAVYSGTTVVLHFGPTGCLLASLLIERVARWSGKKVVHGGIAQEECTNVNYHESRRL